MTLPQIDGCTESDGGGLGRLSLCSGIFSSLIYVLETAKTGSQLEKNNTKREEMRDMVCASWRMLLVDLGC